MQKNNKASFAEIKKNLFSALVGDILDSLGHRHQFLPQEIKPLFPATPLVGRAMPVVENNVASTQSKKFDANPFGLMFEALDDLKENEVYIATGKSLDFALWGGLMSIRAKKLNAAGAVLNGFHRDTKEILNLNFPVFSRGGYAQDQLGRGKVTNYRVPIQINKVSIEPGDIIFGDQDGVVVIPQNIEKKVLKLAMEKSVGENIVANALNNNMSASEAFEKFQIM